jgi:cytochrome P450
MTFNISLLPLLGASVAGTFLTSKYTNIALSTTLWRAVLGALFVWLSWVSYIYPFYISPLRTVPTVPGFPLWGQFRSIITTECGVPVREWHEQYGPIIRYFFPFGAERLSIADDDAIKQMTVRNPYNYPKPVRAKLWMVRILGEGVLLAEGETHIRQRKALAPGFSIASIRSLVPVFWAKSLQLTNLWSTEIKEEGVKSKYFEVLEWLNRATLDIIGEAGLGTDIDSLNHPDTPLRNAYQLVFAFDIMSRILHGLAAFVPLTKYLPAKMNRDMLASRNIILAKASAIIKDKKAQAKAGTTNIRQKDIIGLIVRDNMKATGADSLSFEAMRDQVMTFLGAG